MNTNNYDTFDFRVAEAEILSLLPDSNGRDFHGNEYPLLLVSGRCISWATATA